jgi:hypothetical protein
MQRNREAGRHRGVVKEEAGSGAERRTCLIIVGPADRENLSLHKKLLGHLFAFFMRIHDELHASSMLSSSCTTWRSISTSFKRRP